jgi:hypothetical protein
MQSAQIGLHGRMNDDETTLSGVPHLQLLEPGYAGLDVVVGFHGAQRTAGAARRSIDLSASGKPLLQRVFKT